MSRRARGVIPRKKACLACTAAKSRCDLGRPACWRCFDRELQCEYGYAAPTAPRPSRLTGDSLLHSPSRGNGVDTAIATPSSTNTVTAAPPSVFGVGLFSAPDDGDDDNRTRTLFPSRQAEDGTGEGVGGAETVSSPTQVVALDDARALPSSSFSNTTTTASSFPDFSNITLLAPLDPSRIRDRWLDFYLTVPGTTSTATTKRAKPYDARTIRLIARTLAAYPAAWARDQAHLPPFVHPLQLRCGRDRGGAPRLPEPLANCLSLLRLCGSAAPGSEAFVAESVAREMARLAALVDPHALPISSGDGLSTARADTDHAAPLAAFQAYLLLAIHIYSAQRSNAASSPSFNPMTISTLQNLAAKVSSTGLVCPEEISPSSPVPASASGSAASAGERRRGGEGPRREAWVLAEAKRRTVCAAYFLENLTNFDAGAPSYLGEELARVPAPAPRWLWAAADAPDDGDERERLWRREWDGWVCLWRGRTALALAEFWPLDDVVGAGVDAEEQARGRDDRMARWAEGVDEFGMFLLAVCTATYGC